LSSWGEEHKTYRGHFCPEITQSQGPITTSLKFMHECCKNSVAWWDIFLKKETEKNLTKNLKTP
jgi:hypothetical protein